jgi:putative ABC transport system substrate-binding protein
MPLRLRFTGLPSVLSLGVALLLAVHTPGEEAPLVGVCWYQKSGMAERVLKGLVEELKQRGDPVRLHVSANLADAAAARAAINANLAAGAKGIICLRSDGAKLLVAEPLPVPGFIGAAGDPVELGVCTDPSKPDRNITGVTYHLPMTQLFGVYRQFWPQLKRVGLLVQEGHPSAAIESKAMRTWCEANGVELTVVACADKVALAKAVKDLRERVDVLIGGNQNVIFDNGALVAQVAAKTPYVSLAEKPVMERQALLGVVPDDAKLGRLLAAAVVAVVVERRPLATVPIQGDDQPRLLVNEARLKALDLTLPAALANTSTLLK